MARVNEFLQMAINRGASDIHLCANTSPMIRLHGDIVKMDNLPPIPAEENMAQLMEIMSAEQKNEFEKTGQLDMSYYVEGVGRFRVNIHREMKGVSGAFRVVPSKLKTADELGIPKAVQDLTQLHQGMVILTGPSGCGKSTTMAALVDLVNETRTDHIICIEDPIEFIHKSKKCHVDQREVGKHTRSFAVALRAALREDPDIIVVGEMRDLETISLAIRAAETGHLVFTTLHTRNAAKTVERVINVFPPDQQSQVRIQMSESLAGVVSQALLKNAKGDGRVLVMEVLIKTTALSALIRDGNTFRIPSVMQTGKKYGMFLMDDHLVQLVEKGTVDPYQALERMEDKKTLMALMAKKGLKI